jgi:hypothetical protein
MSTDSLITDRAIASEIKINALELIKRETNLRRLWATDTLFTTIPCLELIEVPISECCDFQDDCMVARTKERLPRISEGIYQYLIQGVYSINVMSGKGKKLIETSINRYINLLKLPVVKKQTYYWISDGYLYVSNPEVEAIRMAALFEENVSADILFPPCSCGDSPNLEEYCMNPLDRPFALPGYLERQVLEMASKKLLQTYFNIKSDVTQDGLDSQASNINK